MLGINSKKDLGYIVGNKVSLEKTAQTVLLVGSFLLQGPILNKSLLLVIN